MTRTDMESQLFDLIRRLNSLFEEGKFDEVGQEMDSLDTTTMSPDLAVAWMSFTYPAKRQLNTHRESYVARAADRLEEVIGVTRTAKILSRLR